MEGLSLVGNLRFSLKHFKIAIARVLGGSRGGSFSERACIFRIYM